MARWPILLWAIVLAAAVFAQNREAPNCVLLVAKPGLPDPRFRDTVVLVTQTADSQTVGVILNRPTDRKLSDIVADDALARNYSDAVFFGGPVMDRTLVALFRSGSPPAAPAFHVLQGLYLHIHPRAIAPA